MSGKLQRLDRSEETNVTQEHGGLLLHAQPSQCPLHQEARVIKLTWSAVSVERTVAPESQVYNPTTTLSTPSILEV